MSEYMEGLLAPDEKGFTVTDDQKAMWCVNKIKEAKEEEGRFTKHYQEQMQKLTEQTRARVEYFQWLLVPYFNSVPHKKTDTQETYKLPGAKLIRKHRDPTYERDENALLAFLKASGRTACIKTIPATEKASWADYKPLTKEVGGELIDIETGEVVKGVRVIPNEDTFEVKIDG